MPPGPTLSIRNARDEDVESLVRLAQALGMQADVRRVAEDIAAYATGFFVADSGAGIAGYLVLRSEHPPDCVRGRAPLQLWKLYVAPEFQGKGVAASLMSQAFAVAREWANDVIWLGTAEDNARAIAFYRKNGFAPIGFAALHHDEASHSDLIMLSEIMLSEIMVSEIMACERGVGQAML